MKKLKLFQKTSAKAVVAFFFIFCFLLSLSLPYSSDYFSQDNKIVTRSAANGMVEKVEVSTNFNTSPAECLTSKSVRSISFLSVNWVKSLHTEVLIALEAHKYRTYFRSDYGVSPITWHPSIVIAFRKLII
jgi:hypothetical protein